MEPLLFVCLGLVMRTIVYVDGFNLYYGCLKGSSYKWLDLYKLFSYLLSNKNEIIAIKYFTARVRPTNYNPYIADRQSIYLRAIQNYIPMLEIHEGYFSSHYTRTQNANPPPNTVGVIRTEEKGSDVNLSVHMLNDAWKNDYDCAVIVSNDSDMQESMRLIKEYHPDKILGLICPDENGTISHRLQQYADFKKRIRSGVLKNSQLPDNIPETNIRKPDNW